MSPKDEDLTMAGRLLGVDDCEVERPTFRQNEGWEGVVALMALSGCLL
ncbi:hypothetical protein TIFTF001_011488 [Ficus carica]|uniref:Uncharacterized protein n=1 Tax=Ficus carica TaxID=3494 RepID=A0AA88D2W8_FICCA|nr:hypothetical protein TIFTF001_011488 [Ficus carica]